MRNGREKRGLSQLNVEVRREVREQMKEEAAKEGVSIGEWLTRRLGYGEVELPANSLMAIYGGGSNEEIRHIDPPAQAARRLEEHVDKGGKEDAGVQLLGSGHVAVAPANRKMNPLLAVYGGGDGGVRSAVERAEDLRSAKQAVEQEMPGLVSVRDAGDSGSDGYDAGGSLVILDLDGETVKCCMKCYRSTGVPGERCKTCRGLNETGSA